MGKINFTITIIFSTVFSSGLVMANEKLANEVIYRTEAELSKYFGKKLSKPIHLYYKKEQSEEKKKWPTSWGPEKDRFGLGLHDDFSLEKTWWNMNGVDEAMLRNASLEQKYTLTLTHEMAHIFMFPTPLKAWFQEAVAMNIGKEIALRLDPTLEQFFPNTFPPTKITELQKYTYQMISKDEQACKKLQLSAMGLASRFSQSQILDWIKANRPKGYNPLDDNRENEVIEKTLINSMPK
ncbi:MAG: hypothetical protein HOE90_13015 [Bacteriovoracaceae bacterium]|jgi:hypothetical protein|nr:hypothetical protein [Bacteriovoracaceae bacterium]